MAGQENFLRYGVGDIASLSDLQTQKEFKKMEVDFRIIETRNFRHPEGIFTYTGYLAVYQATPDDDEQQILILVRQIGDDFDLRVFYMDSDGPSESFQDLFVEDEDDLVDRFDATLHFEEDNTDLEITWDRQGQSNFGVKCISSNSQDTNIKTIAEYFTNDDTRGNPHCLIEWTGDKLGGYIEIWYGCEIRETDLEMYHTK